MGVLIRRVPAVVGRRQIHQARIFGSQETMTAVIYDGPDFEKASHNVLPGGCMLIYPWYSGGRKWKCVSGAGVYCWRLKQHDVDWGSMHSLILQLFGITRSARVNGLIYRHGA
jgi:hypothetical protein